MREDKFTFQGVSQFFFAMIPWALAFAACTWLAFGEELRDFYRHITQAHRHAEIVGAARLPIEPIKIIIKQPKDSPIVIERAEIDDEDLWVYYRNYSHSRTDYIMLSWKETAPDETVIKQGKLNPRYESENDAPNSLEVMEAGEGHFKIPDDLRAKKLFLEMTGR